MKSVALRTAVALAGVGGLGVAAHQGYKALTKEETPITPKQTIRDKLIADKYELLDSKPTKDDHWTGILDSYQKIASKQDALKFKDFDGTGSEAKQKLQKLCNDAFDSEDTTDYEKIKKWCVVPVDISTLLGKRNFNILRTDEGSSSEVSKVWEEKIKSYKKLETEELKIENLSLTNNKEQAEEQDYKNIKAKCNEIKTKKTYEEGFESLLKKFESWCANKNI